MTFAAADNERGRRTTDFVSRDDFQSFERNCGDSAVAGVGEKAVFTILIERDVVVAEVAIDRAFADFERLDRLGVRAVAVPVRVEGNHF